jgi:hypothetical protein
MTYLGFEPGTFGYQVGNATNRTIEVVERKHEGSVQNPEVLVRKTQSFGTKFQSFGSKT